MVDLLSNSFDNEPFFAADNIKNEKQADIHLFTIEHVVSTFYPRYIFFPF
jgi:hypothetical protein